MSKKSLVDVFKENYVNAKFLDSGSTRDVFLLDKNLIVKVANCPAGQKQNFNEFNFLEISPEFCGSLFPMPKELKEFMGIKNALYFTEYCESIKNYLNTKFLNLGYDLDENYCYSEIVSHLNLAVKQRFLEDTQLISWVIDSFKNCTNPIASISEVLYESLNAKFQDYFCDEISVGVIKESEVRWDNIGIDSFNCFKIIDCGIYDDKYYYWLEDDTNATKKIYI